ncbi:BlaI/MecI/CopY family transcriptional regulator [Clostridioides difficile]|uniref:Regulatory protein n=2 Tax=Clostridioides difficile TaxID=1496 RepID=A0AB74QHZ3_CLODI|nr:BlaI/MecI/CopY family transcriptional regulator [Clostridioides difficile]EGT3815256.1 BlaI/MecI/CopY family transcriptional regulator [Clostridioides difficile]EGT3953417.1 BlaI/MecI/CopY family transcriptional regulator [Clostridioides difficile]EGT4202963.1 BlaI/MecI/CopY family transcriptional regulator [Clostridioides difficile]ELX4570404.1 BlaI/MecI/CopY family transcriptional regulator [Clostridioides difficile]MBS1300531.1 BlaI/MecI/CopY family transcriptional regulator [Clostridioi
MHIQKIPKSEFKVMKFIWEINDIITSKMVTENMREKYSWKTTTTLTFLKKLVEKHFLNAEKINGLTHYRILITKEEYIKFATKKFLEDIHDNSIESLIDSLLVILKTPKK